MPKEYGTPVAITLQPPPWYRGRPEHWRYFEIDLLYPLFSVLRSRGDTVERQRRIAPGLVPDLVVLSDDGRTVIEVKKGTAGLQAWRQLLAYVSCLEISGLGPVRGVLAAQRLDLPDELAGATWFAFLPLQVTVEAV